MNCKIHLCFVSPVVLPGVREDAKGGLPPGCAAWVSSREVRPGGNKELLPCQVSSRESSGCSQQLARHLLTCHKGSHGRALQPPKPPDSRQTLLRSLQHNLSTVEGRAGCQQAARRRDVASGAYPEASRHQPSTASGLPQLPRSCVWCDLVHLLTKAVGGRLTPKSHWCCGPKAVRNSTELGG